MKKKLIFILGLCMVLSLTACGSAKKNRTEVIVFAAASLQEPLDAAIEEYQRVEPDAVIVATYDSSGTLKTQIQEGAPCDLFISAAPKQMNALDGSFKADFEKNPDGLDLIDSESRIDLLENKVTLAVPEGNPAGIESFDQLAGLLKNGDVLLAIGNSDVPVGQYTQKIFSHYGIKESTIAAKLTYGSNAKEVATQVVEAMVDCGIIYGTDAYSAELTVVDEATPEMCGQVIYPAAVINSGNQADTAQAFLNYLCAKETMALFEAVGFSSLVN